MTTYSPRDFESRQVNSSVYIKLPDRRFPLRFTRTTEQHWKRTDGLADGRTWATHQQLAVLANTHGLTNPFTGGTT